MSKLLKGCGTAALLQVIFLSLLFVCEVPDDLHDASPMGNPFLEEEEEKEEGKAEPPSFTLAIISRRSRLRAGMHVMTLQNYQA